MCPVATCIGKTIGAARIEADIWADVEQFIRDPSVALRLMAARGSSQAGAVETQRDALARIQAQLDAFQAERDTAVALFTRKRISERDLDHQLDRIKREEDDARVDHAKVMAALSAANTQADRMASARTLLQQLHARLDEGPITPELRRMAVETLIVGIHIKTEVVTDPETDEVILSTRGKVKHWANAIVTYCFDPPEAREQTESATARVLDASMPAPRH